MAFDEDMFVLHAQLNGRIWDAGIRSRCLFLLICVIGFAWDGVDTLLDLDRSVCVGCMFKSVLVTAGGDCC